MTEHLLDSNVLVRFLTNDMPDRAAAARRLLERAATGQVYLHLTATTLAEIVWVLEKLYGWRKPDIAVKLKPMIRLAGLDVAEAPVIEHALDLYSTHNIDYIDGYQAAYALAHGMRAIVSYDRHFDRVPGLQRIEP